MEAVEAYHLENPPEAILEGSYSSLCGKYSVISPKLYQKNDQLLF